MYAIYMCIKIFIFAYGLFLGLSQNPGSWWLAQGTTLMAAKCIWL